MHKSAGVTPACHTPPHPRASAPLPPSPSEPALLTGVRGAAVTAAAAVAAAVCWLGRVQHAHAPHPPCSLPSTSLHPPPLTQRAPHRSPRSCCHCCRCRRRRRLLAGAGAACSRPPSPMLPALHLPPPPPPHPASPSPESEELLSLLPLPSPPPSAGWGGCSMLTLGIVFRCVRRSSL